MSLLKNISDFHIAGISYRNTDAETRGRFAINEQQYRNLLSTAADFGIEEFFVVSTCNRTEIYGFAPSAAHLAGFLCSQTEGDGNSFHQLSYRKNGRSALEHLFHVSAGLDSQILGDYEIISQIKLAVKTAKENRCTGLFTEKLLDHTLQSSRNIRSRTQLSSGSVSVSFAAAQYIRQHFTETADKKILLLGTGKIGRNTCKNIVSTLGTKDITLINRTNAKAEALARELGIRFQPYECLETEAARADVILVATNAPQPTLLQKHLEHSAASLVIDLSIPNNVEMSVAGYKGICLVNVDELSKVADATLQKRKLEIPKAQQLIQEQINEFKNWYVMRQHVPVIRAVKSTLENIQQKHMQQDSVPLQSDDRIQKVLNNMATQMREKNEGGCNFIWAINDFMASS
ncbi:MAG: glutamyl-tRNA reductase [Chitinophagaceae bacterium]